jgi:hypothetical protein
VFATKRDQSKYQESHIAVLLFNVAKSRAKRNGLEFDIDISDVDIPNVCPILKIPLDHSRGKGRRFNGASLDRINPKLGYIKGNVWVISDLANMMKSYASIAQLKTFGEWTQTLQEA